MPKKPIPDVPLEALRQVHANLVSHGVKYGLGAKAPSLDCDTSAIKKIDCSGLVRCELAKATGGKLIIDDGSWYQREWCEENGLHRVNYRDLPQADDSRLFIAFIKPHVNGAGSVGHVWFVHRRGTAAPRTMESYGGHGAGGRPWNTSVLLRQVAACFELPTR